MNRTVILANGDFPRKGGAAWKLLVGATRVVACDGAADAYRRRFRKWPTVISGDLDSLSRLPSCVSRPPTLVKVADQDTNDLEKAIAYCAKQGWRDPVIVGATGKREDHTLGNVFRALAYGCAVVTDLGRFIPVCGQATLTVAKGAAVSVFALSGCADDHRVTPAALRAVGHGLLEVVGVLIGNPDERRRT